MLIKISLSFPESDTWPNHLTIIFFSFFSFRSAARDEQWTERTITTSFLALLLLGCFAVRKFGAECGVCVVKCVEREEGYMGNRTYVMSSEL